MCKLGPPDTHQGVHSPQRARVQNRRRPRGPSTLHYAWLVSGAWLWDTQWTGARQAPLSMGILQVRILEQNNEMWHILTNWAIRGALGIPQGNEKEPPAAHETVWMTPHTESRQPDTKNPDCAMKHAECKNSPANLLQGKSGSVTLAGQWWRQEGQRVGVQVTRLSPGFWEFTECLPRE